MGKVKITERQSEKLALEKNSRLSPFLEKCCLRLVANESFENAEKDIEMMTGIKVSGSSQHRLVQRYEFAPVEVKGAVTALSIDGGLSLVSLFLFRARSVLQDLITEKSPIPQ